MDIFVSTMGKFYRIVGWFCIEKFKFCYEYTEIKN